MTIEVSGMPKVLVLGPVAVVGPDGTQTVLRGQQAMVLALLAEAAPRPVSTDALVDELWPHGAPASARTGIAVVMHRLRQRLGSSESIVNEGTNYRLTVDADDIDHVRFERQLSSIERAGATDHDRSIAALEAALALWRGRVFEPVEHCERLEAAAQAIEARRADGEERLADLLLAANRPQDAAAWATQLVEHDPFREHRHVQLIRALDRCGRRAEALQAAASARRLLRDELGVDPGPALVDVESHVLEGSPAPVPAPTDGGAYLDVPSPSSEIPFRSPTAAYVTREDLEASLLTLLRNADLVTVTGPMGVGKSRLVERTLAGTDDRLLWFDLGGVERGVVDTIASRLGVRVDETVDALVASLDDRPTVLVLDNADQVTAEIAEFAPRLLAMSEKLTTVVTSRHATSTPGERILPVHALDAVRGVELLRLLAPIAVRDEDPDELTELVERLDGIPLCIELVAPALADGSASRACAELDDVLRRAERVGLPDERHRSLDAAFSWSLDMHPPTARDLFAAAAVFNGPFERNDLAAVADRSATDLDRDLMTLLGARLVERLDGSPTPQYRLLTAARIHGRGRWSAATRTALTERHTQHIARTVIDEYDRLVGPDEARAVARLRAIDAELAPAFQRLRQGPDADMLHRFARTLWEHDFLRQRHDRFGWLELAAAHPGSEAAPQHVGVLASAALAAWANDRFDQALVLADRADDAAAALGEPPPLDAIKARFNTAVHRHEHDRSVTLGLRMISASKEQTNPRYHADTLVVVALGQAQLGMLDDAMRTAEKSLALAVETANPTSISWSRCAVGAVQLPTDARAAARTFNAAARLAHSVSSTFVEGMALTGLVSALRRSDRHRQAERVLAGVLDLWARSRAIVQIHRCGSEAALLLLERGDVAAAARVAAALDLADRNHPLLPDDEQRLERALDELDLDQPIDFTTGAADAARTIVDTVRAALTQPSPPRAEADRSNS